MMRLKENLINFIDDATYYLFAEFYNEKANINEIENKVTLLLNNEKALRFLGDFENIKQDIKKDIHLTYESDPASNTLAEIAMCYPGIYAITIYRIAHIFYELDEKVIARVCSEIAHSKTGIDINPGAKIASPFFIDHGTGVVIGETSVIGKNVKIYQGVTLGALSLEHCNEVRGKKRHPTIEDNVTIYAYATVLGGNTVIGENSIIGTSALITKSVEKNSKIVSKCKH